MNAKKLLPLLLLALFIPALSGCERRDLSNRSGSNVVRIGFLGALTGDVAMFGKPSLDGMKLAVEEVNSAGGVLGKRLEIVQADDRGDKQEGAAITQKFIGRDGVVAIVGDPTTGITKVAAPIAQRSRVVLISAGATGPGVVEIGEYIFRDTLLDSVAIPACIDYFANGLRFKKVAVITSVNNDYSVGLSGTFREAAGRAGGISVVADEKIQDGDKDFSAQITTIKGKHPDVIFFSGYYTEGALIMKEARKQGVRVPMFGGDGLFSPKFIELGGTAVEGSMVALGFSPEHAGPETTRFVNGYRAKYNGEIPGVFAAQAYDAVLILADAMRRAGSTDPAVFRSALAQTKNFRGASGTITIRPNREPIKTPLSLLEVKTGTFTLKVQVPVRME